jgi:hypothetical protein
VQPESQAAEGRRKIVAAVGRWQLETTWANQTSLDAEILAAPQPLRSVLTRARPCLLPGNLAPPSLLAAAAIRLPGPLSLKTLSSRKM